MLNSIVCVLVCLSWLSGQLLLLHSNLSSGEVTNNSHLSQKRFTINCDPHYDTSCNNNWTLNTIAENATETSHVDIEITASKLQLKGRVEFSGHESLTITGDNTVISCTERDSGIVFMVTRNVTLDDIIVTNCGTQSINSSYVCAILLVRCGDIVITNVSVTKNSGTGVSFIDHQGGIVHILDSNFTKNMITVDDEYDVYAWQKLRGGGGVFVGNYVNNPSSNTVFHFENCIFAENIPHSRWYNYVYTDELGVPISGYGCGGGVLLMFAPALTNIHVKFHECKFLKNTGFLGGGLFAVILGGKQGQEARNITVTVRDSLFEANGCNSESPTGSGGGAHLSFNTLKKQNLLHSAFRFINVNFSNNCAEIGGGVYFYSNHRETKAVLNTLDFDNCTFVGNQAHTGTAIDLTPNIFDRLANGFLLIPTIKDCQFLSNKNVRSIKTKITFGTGTIYSSQYSIKFEGHTRFFNNSGTGLYIVNGLADFSDGDATFIHNRGNRGGAVALIGLSSLVVGTEGNYVFVNNTAYDSGGAIYSLMVDKHDYTVSRSCFIQCANSSYRDRVIPLSEWKANITFVGNRAKSGTGHAIFATSLYPCQVVTNGTVTRYNCAQIILVNISEALSLRGLTFDDDPGLQPQVATEGAVLDIKSDLPLQIIPGQQYSHGVTLTDDLGNPVDTTFRASIRNNPNIKLGSRISSCLSDQVTLKGEPNQTAQLVLQTVSQRQIHIQLEFELVSCPPGFKLEQGGCVCNVHAFTGLLRCDTNLLHSYLANGFWIGLIHENYNSSKTELATAICPPGFCDYNDSQYNIILLMSGVILPQNVSLLDEAICGKSRTGRICGDCRTGYTTHFHSPNFYCKPVQPNLCKIGWLFYILSELLPVTVVFLSVLALNISFTSGVVNGFVLFSQLINSMNIDAGGLIPLSNSLVVSIQGYKIIYGFFNLDYFNVETLSYCLWTNASALDMIAFKYVTIIYALILIVIVVWFMNKCGGRCLGKWCRITKLNASVTHGITTFLVICYAQCMNVSLTLLLRYQYELQAGSQLKTFGVVWLNGNLAYFSGRHLLYALPALTCILTIGILPLIFLLFYPLTYKLIATFGFEETKVIGFISDKLPIGILKPILDSFQGCFRDNLRFFAGLYFVYRWVGLTVHAFASSYSSFYTVVEILLLCMLALHAICQPYIKRTYNTIDTLLFTDLAVINAISFANYYRVRNYGEKLYRMNNASATVQLVLIYLPAGIFAMYIIFILCQRCLQHRNKYEIRLLERSLNNHTSFNSRIQRMQLSAIFSSASGIISRGKIPDELITSDNEYRYMQD